VQAGLAISNFATQSYFRFFFFPDSFFIALVGLTNEGDKGSKEQQITPCHKSSRQLVSYLALLIGLGSH
jgi:hypothetical protein